MQSETQHAVITGGTGSLGRALACALQDPCWTLAAPGSHELDVRDPAAIERFFNARPVDLLVCAAGITRDAPFAKLSENAWNETWAVNFTGAAACAHAVLPGMIERGCGHIIFISSFSALHPPPGQAAYATAKAALLGLTRDLAGRHGPSNIRVNAILPGFLESRMTEAVSDSRRAEVLAAHTLGRFNTCDRVAAFIRFLHHELPHTSGQLFQLDSR
jgi:3-oxoacyl-[acyl-carrier protein] reductase